MAAWFEALGQATPKRSPQRTPRTNALNSTENAPIFPGEKFPILWGDRLTTTEAIAGLNHFSQLARTENRVVLFGMEKNDFCVRGDRSTATEAIA